MSKKDKEYFVIRKKAVPGIVMTIPMFAVLISKGDIGPLILFILGIGLGIYIGYFVHE